MKISSPKKKLENFHTDKIKELNESNQLPNLYYNYVGNGNKTIVFLHGNSFNSESFSFQIKSELANQFRLLTIDLPGHGESPPAENPENIYSLPALSDIVSKTIKNIVNGPFILAGHSLGGHIAIECIPQIKKCIGLIIWGTPPLTTLADLQTQFLPHPDLHLAYTEKLNPKELNRLAAVYTDEHSAHFEFVKNAIIKSDGKFRPTIGKSLMSGEFPNEREIIESLDIPITIFHGNNENLINIDYLKSLQLKNLWQNKIHIIDKAGHCCQLEMPQTFNKLLKDFIIQNKSIMNYEPGK